MLSLQPLKQQNRLFALVLFILALLSADTGCLYAARTNDLKADWSDTQNPNDPWAYNEGNTPLPHTGCAFLNCSPWTNCQPAWARGDVCPTQGGSAPVLPTVYKAVTNDWEPLQYDVQPGDIILHSRDDA